MAPEDIKARLDTIQQQLEQVTEALTRCQQDYNIGLRIESANTRDIEKLKRHVADLQSRARAGTIPTHHTHEGPL